MRIRSYAGAAIACMSILAAPAVASAHAPHVHVQRMQALIRVTSGDTFQAVVRHSYQRVRLAGASAPDTHAARHVLRHYLKSVPRRAHIDLLVYGRRSTGELLADAVQVENRSPFPGTSASAFMIVAGVADGVPLDSQW